MIQFSPNQNVLIVGAHTDDSELGAGGLISRMSRMGIKVSIAHLSDTSNIYGPETGSRLREESANAFVALGGNPDRIFFGNFPTRHFGERRQEVLDYLIGLKKFISPQIVVGPSVRDCHQDHSVVAAEILRAFRGSTILGYDSFWNLTTQDTTVVVELSPRDVDRKLQALGCFASQSSRRYMDPEVTKAQLVLRGSQRGFAFAESFEAVQISVELPHEST